MAQIQNTLARYRLLKRRIKELNTELRTAKLEQVVNAKTLLDSDYPSRDLRTEIANDLNDLTK